MRKTRASIIAACCVPRAGLTNTYLAQSHKSGPYRFQVPEIEH